MTILMVSDFNFSSIGGVQSSVRSQVDELRRQGHKVVLLCPANDQQYGMTTDDVFYVPSFRFIQINSHAVASPFGYSVRRLVEDLQAVGHFDIVHAQTTSILGAQAREIADRLSVPLVQTMHGRDDVFVERTMRFPLVAACTLYVIDRLFIRQRVYYPLDSLSRVGRMMWNIMLNRAGRADAVTIPSHHFTNKFIAKGLDPSKVTVISNGIADAIVDSVIPKNPEGVHRPSFLWAGRMSAEKQPELAIAAVAAHDTATLDLYGSGSIVAHCQKMIDDLGVGDRVKMHGVYNGTDIYSIMSKYDALLYTSYGFDNQPVVLLEATVAGLPVIYCDPDMTECVPEGAGLLSAAPTAESVGDAVATLSNDSTLLQDMKLRSIAARDMCRQSVHTTKMVELYTSIREKTA